MMPMTVWMMSCSTSPPLGGMLLWLRQELLRRHRTCHLLTLTLSLLPWLAPDHLVLTVGGVVVQHRVRLVEGIFILLLHQAIDHLLPPPTTLRLPLHPPRNTLGHPVVVVLGGIVPQLVVVHQAVDIALVLQQPTRAVEMVKAPLEMPPKWGREGSWGWKQRGFQLPQWCQHKLWDEPSS